ncbi:unnamed protein product [Urochloa humidicola]
MSKKVLLEFSKLKHQQNLVDREKALKADFCKTAQITEEDLYNVQNEDGILVSGPTKQVWTFEMGKDLVCPEELGGLPMKMRKLHEWYKDQSGMYFGVRYPKRFFGAIVDNTTHHEKWMKFESLHELYQQDALDINILFLWCLMESHQLKERGIKDVAFLDPVAVNEMTIAQPDTAHYLYNAFCKLKMNTSILLPYNFLSIKVYDSKDRPLTMIDPLLQVLNRIFKMFCKKKENRGFHRPYCTKEFKYHLSSGSKSSRWGTIIAGTMSCTTSTATLAMTLPLYVIRKKR